MPETKGLSLEEIERQFADMHTRGAGNAAVDDEPRPLTHEIT